VLIGTVKNGRGEEEQHAERHRDDADDGEPVGRVTIARAGMQLVPEDRRIFGSLNVEENLVLAGLTARSASRSGASTRLFRG
jgi:ABC-type branched-subunit amino acid transport system ATPase component